MLFSSLTFLLLFLPVFLIIFAVIPEGWRNGWTFFASLLFYGWSSPKLVILLLFEIGLSFFAGLWMEKKPAYRKKIGWGAILCILGFLLYFKYLNFMLESLNALFHTRISLLGIVLPLGISFYTFQILSYLIDVQKDRVSVCHSFIRYGCYISMFPQLIAGPIIRYGEIDYQLNHHPAGPDERYHGLLRFLCGLAKKVVLADGLYQFWSEYQTSVNPSWVFAVMAAAALTLYTYYDFSGYSDMAIGLARMLGFHFPENFRYPLMASTFTEFWRRWHISLTGWLKDYIYIPLGGSRKGKIKTIRNLLIVWLITGLWHGAAWNFVCWGLLFFFLLVLEKYVISKRVQSTGLYHLFVLLILCGSFLLFHASSLREFTDWIRQFAGLGQLPFINATSLVLIQNSGMVLILAVIGCGDWVHRLYEKVADQPGFMMINAAAAVLLFIYILSALANASYSPFLYFRF